MKNALGYDGTHESGVATGGMPKAEYLPGKKKEFNNLPNVVPENL